MYKSKKYNKSSKFKGKTNYSYSKNYRASRIPIDKYIVSHTNNLAIEAYKPKHRFLDLDISPIVKANILKKEYIYPTRIQDEIIPYIIKGRDVLGLAETGSGKTAAFLIPTISKALTNRTQKVLIVTPTRELATQIESEFKQFAFSTGLRSVLVIGGASINVQIMLLKRTPTFVIATPGRLKDLFLRKAINLDDYNNIILDEVDRMLDMGFIHDVRFIISKLRQERQTLFFSATMNQKAQTISESLLNNPVKVQITGKQAPSTIEQNVIRLSSHKEKYSKLHTLLKNTELKKVLIFTRTKRRADKLSTDLSGHGFKVGTLHGNKSQGARNRVIDKFRRDEIAVLVATDVAARGLDIPDITHVINYDEPDNYDDYLHRIGRTGRAHKQGQALTFVC